MKFKTTITVEAIQWDGVNRFDIARFIRGASLDIDDNLLYPGEYVALPTTEGLMTVHRWDWIIMDTKGHFSICKPNDFAANYEAVE